MMLVRYCRLVIFCVLYGLMFSGPLALNRLSGSVAYGQVLQEDVNSQATYFQSDSGASYYEMSGSQTYSTPEGYYILRDQPTVKLLDSNDDEDNQDYF